MSFQTPILFLVFNRPDTTEAVFNRIRKIRPANLYVAADGPRGNKENEVELCSKVRQVIEEGIDWDCAVHRLYRNENLGCGKAVSGAITWFFEQVEEGIILEDDTYPDLTFFYFCEELLKRYRDRDNVFMISGNNFRLNRKRIPDSYTFTKYCNIWGWATWKRAWNFYDFQIKDWPELHKSNFLKGTFKDKREIQYWEQVFDKTYHGLEDTWDYQWFHAFLKQDALAIEPAVNLVKNIGFREDATHTKGSADNYLFGNLAVENLTITQHPKTIKRDIAGDRITFSNRYLNGILSHKQRHPPISLIKNWASRIKAYLFPNTPFRMKERYGNLKKFIASKLSSK